MCIIHVILLLILSHLVLDAWLMQFLFQLERRHEQMKKNLEAQYKELEEKRRQFGEEKVNWETQQRILEQQKLDSSKWDTLRSLFFWVFFSLFLSYSFFALVT